MILTGWKSKDEEKRKLRVHIELLKRSLRQQQEKNKRLEKENQELKRQIEEMREQLEEIQKVVEKLKRQCDMYRKLLFKENKKSKDRRVDDSNNKSGSNVAGIATNKKKSGAWNGHKGYRRRTPRQVDKIIKLHLTHCPHCNNRLKRGNTWEERILEDLPELGQIRALAIQYLIERQWCGHCQKEVKAKAKFLLPRTQFGLNFTTYIMTLRYGAKLPFKKIKELIEQSYGMEVSEGGIVYQLKLAQRWLGKAYDKIIEKVRASPIKHADETSWRVDGINSWVWAFLTKEEIYLRIEESRGKGVAEEALGGSHKRDVLVRDDYGAYMKLEMKQQSCWAHLLRVSKEEAEQEHASKEVKHLDKKLRLMFVELSKIIDSPFRTKERQKKYKGFARKIKDIAGREYKQEDSKRIQTRIRNQGKKLIEAILHKKVPLTNNLAERELRSMVVMRKITGGSRSWEGAKTQAVNMSIYQTIKMQNKPVLQTLKRQLYLGGSGIG